MSEVIHKNLERRGHLRIDTEIDAQITLAGKQPINVTIRNYCPGGLFIDYEKTQDALDGRQLPKGYALRVSLVHSRTQETLHADLKIANAFDHSIGASFVDEEDSFIAALEQITQEIRSNQPQDKICHTQLSSPVELHQALADIITRYFNIQYPNFNMQMCDALQSAGINATSNVRRETYVQASLILKENVDDIHQSHVENILKSLQELFGKHSNKPTPSLCDLHAKDLSLIDDDAFEEWVMISGLASSIESKVSNELYALEQRLKQATQHSVDKNDNPVSPHKFSWSFKDSLDKYDIGVEAKKIIYKKLGEVLGENLTSLYADIIASLEEHGITEEAIQSAVQTSPTPSQSSNQPANASNEEFHSLEGDYIPQEEQQQLFKNLRSLFASAKTRSNDYHSSENQNSVGGNLEFSPRQILNALPHISTDVQKPLADRILLSLNDENASLGVTGSLNTELQEVIEITDNLVRSFEQDDKLAPALQGPLAVLEIPLLQAALENPQFLADNTHPAHSVINGIERLSIALSGANVNDPRTETISSTIKRVIQTIGQRTHDGDDAFSYAEEDISHLVKQETRTFKLNIERVVESCKGETRLAKAKMAVSEILEDKIGSKDVPVILANLLMLGWPSLLVLTCLREGKDGQLFKQYIQVIDNIIDWLDESHEEPPVSQDEFIEFSKILKDGFSKAPSNPAKVTRLVETLTKALIGNSKIYKLLQSKKIKINPQTIQAISTNSNAKNIADLNPKHYGQWISTVRHLQVGDWIAEHNKRGTKLPLNLVWKNDDTSRYVFANGKGLKTLDCDAQVLAEGLRTHKYSIIENGDLPLLDRSVQRMMRKTFEENSAEVTKDHLTGLLNRRSFEVKLQETLESAWAENSKHIMAVIDLDQFKLVNDLSGYEAGDALLKKTASILKTYSSDNMIIARLGDDEFGILIEDYSEKEGLQFAETQCTAINNLNFAWEGHPYNVSASIGLSIINRQAEDIYSIIRDADSACFLAKESGQNQVRLYNAKDNLLEKQRLLAKSATRIDSAIQNDRLQLHLQPIVPIDSESDLKSHYEVLLRVLDDDDRPMPPGEFIEAAEAYNRMQALDTWVIQTLFRWLEEHEEQASALGGFSINLSGQSIGDARILELILSELRATRYPVGKIAFEITETVTIGNQAKAEEFIKTIQKEGCEFYLDDFGTGLSSYEYLKSYPVDCIKIDGCFIRHILEDETDQAMVRSITEIGHFMKKRVIAEFVENSEILELLGEIGVDYAQGWGVGKPFPLQDLA